MPEFAGAVRLLEVRYGRVDCRQNIPNCLVMLRTGILILALLTVDVAAIVLGDLAFWIVVCALSVVALPGIPSTETYP